MLLASHPVTQKAVGTFLKSLSELPLPLDFCQCGLSSMFLVCSRLRAAVRLVPVVWLSPRHYAVSDQGAYLLYLALHCKCPAQSPRGNRHSVPALRHFHHPITPLCIRAHTVWSEKEENTKMTFIGWKSKETVWKQKQARQRAGNRWGLSEKCPS